MIRRLPHAIGVDLERGTVEVDGTLAARYAAAVGDTATLRADGELPLGLALALRGGPLPAVELEPDTISVHGGHTVSLFARFASPGSYRVSARIDEIFEKSGRSGPLIVVARSSRLRDAAGEIVAVVEDQQIVRWRAAVATTESSPASTPTTSRLSAAHELDVGALIAVEQRAAPDGADVQRYAAGLAEPESLFVDPAFARQLGFADVIVPGPLQSALLEHLLARRLPHWRLERLSLSFRISVVASEAITLAALVTELDEGETGSRLVLDLTVENARGDRAAVGTAALQRRR
jgi:hydroxyacyl-ACP dehydratase HTD2-like protein with hotdog domain